mgnify:FL=1
MSIVNVRQLTKTYKNNRGISDLTFSIDESEIFGFIGPNGAGKSTTIRTLLNFVYPTGGSATIFGKDIVKQSKEIRRRVGYLPSEVSYYDDMKVIDLLAYSAKFYGKDAGKRIGELADRFDLDLARKIEDLSFGNRKKVGIVQALLHEPKLLILDEPTSGLDPLVQHTFFDLLREEREKGVTVFFSSHILSEVQKMCDRVAIIKEGRLVQVETVDHLIRNQVKKVTLFLDEPDQATFRLDGIVRREMTGDALTVYYKGDIKALLDAVMTVPFRDIRIEEPSLEEVFMHYYAK